MARSWFSIQNAAAEDAATVTIFDEIGMWGITAADFARAFRTITAKVINLEINSPGGSVFDGVAIYNILKGSGKTVNAKVMGVAASIASIVLMAADKITMPANAMVMVHSPMGGVFGTADEMREFADVLDKIKSSLVGTYMKRTGKSEADVLAMLAQDTWMTADEAKAAGFADEVIDKVEVKAVFDLERIPEAARAVFKAAATQPPAKSAEELAADAEAARVAAEAAAQSEQPIADQIAAAAKAAGFEAHTQTWLLQCKSVAEVKARIGVATQITAYCGHLKVEDKQRDEFITQNNSIAEVQAAVVKQRADADQHIDTTRTNSNQPANQALPAVTTAGIWAKRQQTNRSPK